MKEKKIPKARPAPARKQRAVAPKKVAQAVNPITAAFTEEVLQGFKSFAETVKTLVDGFTRWVDENREGIETFKQIYDTFEEELKDLKGTQKQAVEIVRIYRWILTPSTLPMFMAMPIVKIAKKGGDQSKAISQLFVNHFVDNNFEALQAMVERWNDIPIFKDRMQFFQDSLITLQNARVGYNPSNVVIPTLIAQIDGIQTKFMVESGLTPTSITAAKWRNSKGKVYSGVEGRKEFFGEEAKAQPMFLSDEMKSWASDYIFDDLFANTFPFQNAVSDFSRHKIQHGEILDYGSLENTIRAFLILDFLANLCIKLDEHKDSKNPLE